MTQQLELNTTYNFSLRATSILGVGYERAMLCGIIDFATANATQDIAPIHASVLQALPQGTPEDPRKLTYLKLKTSTGEIRIIAQEWLASDPVKVNTADVIVTLKGVEVSKIPTLRALLAQAGFENFVIS